MRWELWYRTKNLGTFWEAYLEPLRSSLFSSRGSTWRHAVNCVSTAQSQFGAGWTALALLLVPVAPVRL